MIKIENGNNPYDSINKAIPIQLYFKHFHSGFWLCEKKFIVMKLRAVSTISYTNFGCVMQLKYYYNIILNIYIIMYIRYTKLYIITISY